MRFAEHPPASDDEREALEFLEAGRALRGLSPAQFQRIEHRLAHPYRRSRGRRWLPVLAGLCVAFLGGAAVAHVVDFSRLPLLGYLFPTQKPIPAPKPLGSRTPPASPSSDSGMPPALLAPQASPSELPPQPQAPRPSAPLSATVTRARRTGSVVGPSVSLSSSGGAARATTAQTPHLSRADVAAPSPEERIAPAPAMPVPAARSPAVSTPAPSTTSTQEDPISAEGRSFSAALAQWHRDHDAEAALAALDLHERRFPHGQIRLEARLLRAEIVLQQGREHEALGLLDSVPLSGLPRGRELQTVRGELRVKHGHCTEGRRDLEHVLTKDPTDALGRRAARALSLCP